MRTRVTPRVVRATTVLLLAGLVGVGVDRSVPAAAESNAIRLADASVIIEVNATDGDAGLQVFLDGDPWREMSVIAPDGRQMSVVSNTGSLRSWGLTELFWESSEPPFDEVPFSLFKRRFPEGIYRFEGTTVEGKPLVGSARLTHDVPKGPVIISPEDGEPVPLGHVLVRWETVPEPPGIEIVGYRVIVEDETSPRGFGLELELRPSLTTVTLPSEFFQAGHEYKLEVMAMVKGGNQTLTEISFSVTG